MHFQRVEVSIKTSLKLSWKRSNGRLLYIKPLNKEDPFEGQSYSSKLLDNIPNSSLSLCNGCIQMELAGEVSNHPKIQLNLKILVKSSKK